MANLNNFIQILQEDNTPAEQIGALIGELSRMSASQMYAKLIQVMDDDENKTLENLEKPDEIDEYISQVYKKHFNESYQESLNRIQEEFVDAFLEKYKITE